MPRPQSILRALLVLMLAVACFFGGVRFEREWHKQRAPALTTAGYRIVNHYFDYDGNPIGRAAQGTPCANDFDTYIRNK